MKNVSVVPCVTVTLYGRTTTYRTAANAADAVADAIVHSVLPDPGNIGFEGRNAYRERRRYLKKKATRRVKPILLKALGK